MVRSAKARTIHYLVQPQYPHDLFMEIGADDHFLSCSAYCCVGKLMPDCRASPPSLAAFPHRV